MFSWQNAFFWNVYVKQKTPTMSAQNEVFGRPGYFLELYSAFSIEKLHSLNKAFWFDFELNYVDYFFVNLAIKEVLDFWVIPLLLSNLILVNLTPEQLFSIIIMSLQTLWPLEIYSTFLFLNRTQPSIR